MSISSQARFSIENFDGKFALSIKQNKVGKAYRVSFPIISGVRDTNLAETARRCFQFCRDNFRLTSSRTQFQQT